MRIGILTQPLHYNYGGILQNYALQQVLIHMGHEVETIDYENHSGNVTWRWCLSNVVHQLLHWIAPNRFKAPVPILSKEEKDILWKNTLGFVNKYIAKTEPLLTHEDFRKLSREGRFQGYVVGSDQCWRPRYNRTFLKEMFLEFTKDDKDIRRIGYAVSFGTSEWELAPEETCELGVLARMFDKVTVRERDGIELCRRNFGVDATLVLDPTMLLSKDYYERLVAEEHEQQSQGKLFYYLLDPDDKKLSAVCNSGLLLNLKPFTVMPKYKLDGITNKQVKKYFNDCIYPPVTKWIRAFMDAEITVVDSFHGMVFSIIFNKPFWVLGNKKRGMSRFTSLLGVLELEDRLVDVAELETKDLSKPIDWNSVNRKIEKLRRQSLEPLQESLKK